jgi:hypothetical protein
MDQKPRGVGRFIEGSTGKYNSKKPFIVPGEYGFMFSCSECTTSPVHLQPAHNPTFSER